jgi:hypothetical protein
VWAELESHLWDSLKLLRAADANHRLEDDLISLPIRLGGMGLLSHWEVAPIAREAADQMVDQTLATLFVDSEDGDGDPERERVQSKGERCMKLFENRSEGLLQKLGDKERKAMVENGSLLGRPRSLQNSSINCERSFSFNAD